MSNKIVCVIPTVRPESHAEFVKAWTPLFEKHQVTLVTVWDGEAPEVTISAPTWADVEREYGAIGGRKRDDGTFEFIPVHEPEHADLFCRRTDACRNLGFVVAARLNPDYVLTLDDDCHPLGSDLICIEVGFPDPIQAHIDALNRRVPLSWMNTAHDTDLYLRGVPYGIRDEAPVMLSHGVWVGTPDFDGETQLRLEAGGETKDGRVTRYMGVPYSLPYYVGPVPRGVLFPLCGMNVMVRREALPYLYYAPQGADSGVPNLHRMADIYMGVVAEREFDRKNWAMVTGYSTILHSRASDARKNYEQEKLGRQWLEWWSAKYNNHSDVPMTPPDVLDTQFDDYFRSYADKRVRYQRLIESILGEGK